MTINPLPGKVVVAVDQENEMTAGGIILPDNARHEGCIGTVVAVSPLGWFEQGSFYSPIVCVGNRVLISKYSGIDIEVNHQRFVVFNHSQILAVLHPAPVPIDEAPSCPSP